MKKSSHRPWEEFLLIGLLVVVAANALYAGFGLMMMPDGAWLGMSIAWLHRSPFSNFFWPGFLLFVFLGCLPMLSAVGLLLQPAWRWPQKANLFVMQHWALSFSTYSGIILCIWIVVQQLLTSYFILQPIVSAAGIIIIMLSLWPRVVRHCTTNSEPL